MPLATHRGWTHSLLGGVLFMPPLLAGLLWLLDRWQIKRGATFASGLEMRFGWLVALSYLGTLTHPLLDWQTSYAVQLFAPFDRRWYHTDTLFIVDVWIWLGLGAAIWWSRRCEARGGRWRAPPTIALAAVVAYVLGNGAITTFAREAPFGDRSQPRAMVMVASPPPVLWWRRDLAWREGHDIWRSHYDPLHTDGRVLDLAGPYPDGMTLPAVRRAARANAGIETFMRWSILPMATATTTMCGTMVKFSDARYPAALGGDRLGRTVFLPTGGRGC
ncbi:MAG: metal-dependent hydrolase [Croceibacterium sp.]